MNDAAISKALLKRGDQSGKPSVAFYDYSDYCDKHDFGNALALVQMAQDGDGVIAAAARCSHAPLPVGMEGGPGANERRYPAP